jgi:hypothetical protein
MTAEIHCEGAPRDLGLDQGRACRGDLRARFERRPRWRRWLRQLGVEEDRTARLARDLTRHYPQQSETIEGLACGTGIPRGWFTETLAVELAAARPTQVGAAAGLAARSALTAGECLVARTLGCEPVVRRSQPEGGFASVELTLPWLTAALAGVNEGGLAVASVSLPGGFAAGGCAVPAALLVQDCLARFDSIDGAVDWCRGRPAGGRGVILLADAAGELAAVEVDGDDRRVVPPQDGLLLAGCAPEDAAALREAAPLDISTAAKILGGRITTIDPERRRIALHDAAPPSATWHPVRAT